MIKGQIVTYTFLTEINGDLVNTDITPSIQIIRNGIVTSVPSSVLLVSTGNYAFSFTVPLGWETGDRIEAIITCVISGFTSRALSCCGEVMDKIEDQVHLALATKNIYSLETGSPEAKINHAATIID